MPLIEGTFPQMPRTFFVGMAIASIGFGLSFLYALLNHPTRTTIDLNQMKIRSERRIFGSIKHYEKEITERTKVAKVRARS